MHDPNVLQILPLPTPQLWHTPSCSPASAWFELTGGPTGYNVLSSMFFNMDGKVLEKCEVLVEHDRQTANRLLKIGALLCEELIIRQNVQTL
jgi:hypothetical protein